MNRRILIIGGGGYIGSVLCPYLANKGNFVTVLDNLIYGQNRPEKNLTQKKNFNFVYGDLRNQNLVKKLLDETEIVILLAGLVGDPITKKYPKISRDINLVGMKKCLLTIRNSKIKQLIFVSTCSNYGKLAKGVVANEKHFLKPLSSYAKDKVKIEHFIKSIFFKSPIGSTILRFATAFGISPRMRFDLTINEFTRILMLKKKLVVYDPETYRPYCHVNDFSRIINKIINSPMKKVNNEIFNCGSKVNNFNKYGVVKVLKKYFPKGEVFFLKKGTKDKRNYLVNFSKIEKKLKIKSKHNISYGIREILINRKKYISKKIKKNNFGNYVINKN